MQTGAGLPGALAAIVAAVADGMLSPEEAQAVAAVLETQRRAIETAGCFQPQKEGSARDFAGLHVKPSEQPDNRAAPEPPDDDLLYNWGDEG